METELFGPKDELRRVLDSKAFSGADAAKRLLTYLTEAAIAGRSTDLKEYTVGVEAFGKPETYDPQVDPTVRVHAGKLRRRLVDYYREEGNSDPLEITFPKGHFCLYFEAKAVAEPADPVQLSEASVPPKHASRQWKIAAIVSACTALTALLALAILLATPAKTTGALKSWGSKMDALWGPLVDNEIPIQIAYETVMFVRIPNATFRSFGVEEPSDAQHSPDVQTFLKAFGSVQPRFEHNYAAFGAVQSMFLISQMLQGRKRTLLLKREPSLTWEEIQENHLLFLGVGKAKPRIRELLANADFVWEEPGFRNRRPRSGEQDRYLPQRNPITSDFTEQYGLISMLPGFREGRRVFIVGTGSSEGDWAAVEYVTTPKYVRELVDHLRAPSGAMPESFQALIRINYRSQVPVAVSYVTHHVLNGKLQPIRVDGPRSE